METIKPAKTRRGFYEACIKRPFDILISLIFLIVLSPVMAAVAILVAIKLGRPVIFKQERPGLNNKIFTIHKFRTMTNETDEDGELLPAARRITKFGDALRDTSLDELPEFFNILKGDMSFVGPRPLCVRYLPYYNAVEQQRHTVRPGLTGLAQVNGRNLLIWEDRFKYDVEYVKNITFLGDLKIIARTFVNVLQRSGVLSQNDFDYEVDFDIYRARQLSEASEGETIEKGNR